MKLRSVVLMSAVLVVAAMVQPSFAGGGALDGKTFSGQMTPKGEKKGDADDFEFKDGKFHSTACDKYGFDSAAYTAKADGKATHFDAVTRSGDSTITWKGEVKGDHVSGTAVMSEKGKTKDYLFAGDLKK